MNADNEVYNFCKFSFLTTVGSNIQCHSKLYYSPPTLYTAQLNVDKTQLHSIGRGWHSTQLRFQEPVELNDVIFQVQVSAALMLSECTAQYSFY